MLARLVRPFSELSTDSTLTFETLTLVVQLVSACYEFFEYVSRMRQLALDDECSRL